MSEMQIEAMLASPPERDEVVVQLFAKHGGQWGEVYRDNNDYWIDLYCSDSSPLRFKVDALVTALSHAQKELRDRLEPS